jgi:hypothetical protein
MLQRDQAMKHARSLGGSARQPVPGARIEPLGHLLAQPIRPIFLGVLVGWTVGCGPLVGIEDVQPVGGGELGGVPACIVCGDTCVSLATAENCGSCGHACAEGEPCLGGVCGRTMGGGPGARALCVRRDSGELVCRGANDVGQLGRGTTSPAEASWEPMLLASGERASFAAASDTVTCLRLDTGEIRCTGSNAVGALGADRAGSDGSLAAPTGLGASFSDLAAGPATEFSSPVCAVGGTSAACWGLGAGSTSPQAIDFGAPGGEWFQVGAGVGFVCFLDTLGSVRCAGSVGETSLTELGPPRAVEAPRVRFLAAAEKTACAIDVRNQVLCWGANEFGERGMGTAAPRISAKPEPVLGEFPAPLVQLVAGSGHFCALDDRGEVYCWGRATSAGDGRTEGASCTNGPCRTLPEQVPIHGVVELAATRSLTIARRADGARFAWGESSAADCLLGDACRDVLWTYPQRLDAP